MRQREDQIKQTLQSISHRAMLSALWEAQRGECGICRKRMDQTRTCRDQNNPRRPTVEHVVPTTLGGFDGRGNLFAAHAKCNNDKGQRYPTEAELGFLDIVNRAMGWPARIRRAA